MSGEPRELSEGVELAAYRVVQEALTNCIKHADAASVHVRIGYCEDILDVDIVDDGRSGGSCQPGSEGHGLAGMRERVAVYGGSLTAGPDDGGGFRVQARLPVDRQTSRVGGP